MILKVLNLGKQKNGVVINRDEKTVGRILYWGRRKWEMVKFEMTFIHLKIKVIVANLIGNKWN